MAFPDDWDFDSMNPADEFMLYEIVSGDIDKEDSEPLFKINHPPKKTKEEKKNERYFFVFLVVVAILVGIIQEILDATAFEALSILIGTVVALILLIVGVGTLMEKIGKNGKIVVCILVFLAVASGIAISIVSNNKIKSNLKELTIDEANSAIEKYDLSVSEVSFKDFNRNAYRATYYINNFDKLSYRDMLSFARKMDCIKYRLSNGELVMIFFEKVISGSDEYIIYEDSNHVLKNGETVLNE